MLLLASCLVTSPNIDNEDDSQSQPLITVGTHELEVGGGINVRYSHVLTSAKLLALCARKPILVIGRSPPSDFSCSPRQLGPLFLWRARLIVVCIKSKKPVAGGGDGGETQPSCSRAV